MASGGDCVLKSAARIPSFHRSGLEPQGHNGTVAATKSVVPGVIGDTGRSRRSRRCRRSRCPGVPRATSPLPSFQSSAQTARAVWSAAQRRSRASAKGEEIDYRARQLE
jgi:hypothetical protein